MLPHRARELGFKVDFSPLPGKDLEHMLLVPFLEVPSITLGKGSEIEWRLDYPRGGYHCITIKTGRTGHQHTMLTIDELAGTGALEGPGSDIPTTYEPDRPTLMMVAGILKKGNKPHGFWTVKNTPPDAQLQTEFRMGDYAETLAPPTGVYFQAVKGGLCRITDTYGEEFRHTTIGGTHTGKYVYFLPSGGDGKWWDVIVGGALFGSVPSPLQDFVHELMRQGPWLAEFEGGNGYFRNKKGDFLIYCRGPNREGWFEIVSQRRTSSLYITPEEVVIPGRGWWDDGARSEVVSGSFKDGELTIQETLPPYGEGAATTLWDVTFPYVIPATYEAVLRR